VPVDWPDDAYGAFYSETTLPLGVPGMYVGSLSNLELMPDRLVVDHLLCDGERQTDAHAVQYEGEEVHVYPRAGDEFVMWRGSPIATELVFRPGATCETLDLEFIDLSPGWGYEDTLRWHRGALVITDTCGPGDDTWALDRSDEVSMECPPPS